MKLVELLLRFLVAVILQLFGFISPANAKFGKRLMFLTSAYAALVKEGIMQEMSIESFNETFHLAEDSALLDATSVANGCWSKINLTSELSKCMLNTEELTDRQDRISLVERFSPIIVKRSPKWMRYDNDEMIRDISDILLVNGFTKMCKEAPHV